MTDTKIHRQMQEFTAIYKETDAIYSGFAKRSGLSDCAFWLMYSLYETNGQCTQKEICGQWTMSKQTVNSALKGLEKNGYIVLTSSDTDKRSKHIELTDKGIQFARENIGIVFELEQRVFQKMSDDERKAMLESNRRYQALLREEAEHFLSN